MIIRWKNKEMDCLQARGLFLTRRSQRLRRAGGIIQMVKECQEVVQVQFRLNNKM